MTRPFQCLLFVPQNAEQEIRELECPSDQSTIKGYVLLPGDFKTSYPKNSKLFLQNGVQVISKDGRFSHLKGETFGVIELIFDPLSSKCLYLSVETPNKQFVSLLFKRNACIRTLLDFGLNSVRLVDEESFAGLKNFLKCGTDIIHKHPKGGTLLHLAVKRRNETLVKLLVENSADVNALRNDRLTPLHLAAKYWELPITQLLIENGAMIDAEKYNGTTPLHIAAELGCTKIVEHLIQKGANVNSTIRSGRNYPRDATPLHCSIKGGHRDVAEILLRGGANVDAYSPDGGTCLFYALKEGHLSITNKILDFHPDVSNECNQVGFHNVIYTRDLREELKDILEKMLQLGFNIVAEDANDFDLLFGAVYHNNVEIVRKLLEFGAEVNERTEDSPYETPLHAAAEFAEEEMIKLLLEFGANINATCNYDDLASTPIRYAIKHKKLKNVQLLLRNGANILYDSGIVYAATIINDPKILEIILQNGADPNFENPKVYQESYDHRDCYRTPLLAAVFEGFLEVVNVLLKYGACIDFCDNLDDKQTPLLAAIEDRNIEMFETLLDCGFSNISLVDRAKARKMLLILRLRRRNGDIELLFEKTFVRHLLKMEAANLPVSNASLARKFKKPWLDKILNECKTEIVDLKNEKIGISDVTFFNILTQNINQVARLLRNDSVLQTLNSKVYKERFPNYGGVIDWQFQKGHHRKILLESAVKMCRLPSNRLFILPFEIFEKILDCMTDQELLISFNVS